MKIAIEGCCHGTLDALYATLLDAQARIGPIDLLLCCGDFQAVRNEYDLQCLAVKEKYRTMNSFHKYYGGEVVAPILTVFIGGNHEASNHHQELQHGGWVAKNIYYLGHSGVLNFGGLRIAGLSGIFKGYNFRKGYYETAPYSENDLRSVYHIRELEILKMSQISTHIDIFLSHDWPKGIISYGDERKLLRVKKFLADEVDSLGSPPSMHLLKTLKPSFWFSAHMHVKFPAIVPHDNSSSTSSTSSSQDPDQSSKPVPIRAANTKFLALDKILPNRDFLQILDFPDGHGPLKLQYDPEWLSVLVAFDSISAKYTSPYNITLPHIVPDLDKVEENVQRIRDLLPDLTVPDNFVRSAPIYNPNNKDMSKITDILETENPQTKHFATMLNCLKQGIKVPPYTKVQVEQNPEEIQINNPDEIQIDNVQNPDEIQIDESETQATNTLPDILPNNVQNPDEIQIDDL